MKKQTFLATLIVALASLSIDVLATAASDEDHRELGWDGSGSGKSGKSGANGWSSGGGHWEWSGGGGDWGSGKSGKSGSSSGNVWHGGWGQPGWWGPPSSKSGKSGGGWEGSSGKYGKSGGSWSSWGGWGGKSSKGGGHWAWGGGGGGWGGKSSKGGGHWAWGGWGGKSSKSKSSKGGGHWAWAGPSWSNGWGKPKPDWQGGGHSDSKPKPVPSPVDSHTGWKDDGWDEDEYYKADLISLREDCSQFISDSGRELIALTLRLVFHSCAGKSRCDGCINMDNLDNRGLKEAVEGLYPMVQKYQDKFSRGDVWAVCAVEAASLAVGDGRKFPLHYVGRQDCEDADEMGFGGKNADVCDDDLTTKGILEFFKTNFGMTETKHVVAIMGIHSAATASRVNSGHGNPGRKDGWVENAEEYKLSNRYFQSVKDPGWELQLTENEKPVPNKFQWYIAPIHQGPIMLNADLALYYDFEDYMQKDGNGTDGLVTCLTDEGNQLEFPEFEGKKIPLCPFAEETKAWVDHFAEDNEDFLDNFGVALEMILSWGYNPK